MYICFWKQFVIVRKLKREVKKLYRSFLYFFVEEIIKTLRQIFISFVQYYIREIALNEDQIYSYEGTYWFSLCSTKTPAHIQKSFYLSQHVKQTLLAPKLANFFSCSKSSEIFSCTKKYLERTINRAFVQFSRQFANRSFSIQQARNPQRNVEKQPKLLVENHVVRVLRFVVEIKP